MKVLILAGGYGTRLSEETAIRPKPMAVIDGKPILWHIMKIYSHYGHNDFIILLGYKGSVIKDYFANYFLHQSSVTFDFSNNHMVVHKNKSEHWKVTLLDTGIDTMTGGRIIQAQPFVENETFMLAYGDTLMDIDIDALLKFHRSHGRAVTMTIAQPEEKYGVVNFNTELLITGFQEKPKGNEKWVNGGFFVCEPSIFQYIKHGDATVWERGPIQNLAKDRNMFAFKHQGFYKCMDTLKDKNRLNRDCKLNSAKWKVWE